MRFAFYLFCKEAEIKLLAKRGQEQAAKTVAKQLISTRQQKQKLMMMKAQVSSTSTQVKVNPKYHLTHLHFIFSPCKLSKS